MKKITYAGLMLLCGVSSMFGAGFLVETESFSNWGGWVNDTQFVDCMGSPYLLAHGLGVPVADASTVVRVPAGTWRIWARTRDWTPTYNGEKPGRFQVTVDGVAQEAVLGIAPADWGWVDAGTFSMESEGDVELGLHDLTGFEGRCDALYVTDVLDAVAPPAGGAELAAWRAALRGESAVPESAASADLVVVGGGIAGTCAAIAAAEEGMSVILLQDRPVLGGNASGEIRVETEGETRHRIVKAVENPNKNGSPNSHASDTNRMAVVAGYPSLECRMGWRAYGVVTNAAREIVAVDARHVETGERLRVTAPLFVDATGDGWLGYWAGAAYRMGREARAEYNESFAPAVADSSTMGNSLLWTTKVCEEFQPFPEVPWAMEVSGTRAATSGDWKWEAGLGPDENTIYDAEMLRDRLFRAIYGSFSTARKNNVANQKRALEWVPYVAGKRESRRIMGDYVVTQSDVQEGRWFEDAVGTATWTIDLHFYSGSSGYLTSTEHRKVGRWYFPYRALCCRDVPNLFLAGRCASFSHVAFGSSRVMNTGGQMGVAVGYAASLCKKYDCAPRDLYRSAAKTVELQGLIGGVWPERSLEAAEVAMPTGAGTGASSGEDEDAVSVIVDNQDTANTLKSGAWISSTSAAAGAFYGSNYLVNKVKSTDKVATCNAETWFAFRPVLPEAGEYAVELIWNSSENRSTNVAVVVTHVGGVSTNRVDMTKGGGAFETLGTWMFDPAGEEVPEVRVLSEGALAMAGKGAYITVDAVRFVKVVAEEPEEPSEGEGDPNVVLVEETEAERSEPEGMAWQRSTSSLLRSGDAYFHNGNGSNADFWALYRPELPATQVYRLQQVWNGDDSRSSAVQVEVKYADESVPVMRTVNQTRDSGRWMTLGTWRFAAGTEGYAKVLTAGSGAKIVVADAFRWKHIPGETIVDEADAVGVETSGTWLVSSHNSDRYGATYWHNGKVSSPDTWVRFTPTITTATTYRVSLFWNASSDRGNAVRVEVVHADGTDVVPVDMTATVHDWAPIGVWRFEAGTAGSVRILTEGSEGKTVIADAVLFTPVNEAAVADSDANGLPDEWERMYFLQLTGTDPDSDADGDGFCNYGEWLAGTDPLDARSTFRIQSIFVENEAESEAPRVTLSWPSVEGRVYAVLRTEDLGEPFSVYLENIEATPPENVVELMEDAEAGFYRVVVMEGEGAVPR